MTDITRQRVVLLVFLFPLAAAVIRSCPHGKYGKRCLSVCLCSWEGTVVCTNDTGNCKCKEGYIGKRCDRDINECDTPNPPCGHPHMYCSNTRGSYRCVCRDGYVMSGVGYCTPCPPFTHMANCSGVCHCDIEKTVYCEGGVCVCRRGWGGSRCDQSHNDCTGVICPESTFCVDRHRSYECKCGQGLRLIEDTCQAFNTTASALEASPGIGELVDVFVFYKLPDVYLYKAHSLPSFVYMLKVEPTGQMLCEINFIHAHSPLIGDEQFLTKMNTAGIIYTVRRGDLGVIMKRKFHNHGIPVSRSAAGGLETDRIVWISDIGMSTVPFRKHWQSTERNITKKTLSMYVLDKVDGRNYNFYSHVKIVFTEAVYSVVRLVPVVDEYYDMILEFDVSHKSVAERDCLIGMRISGTKPQVNIAPRYKRQSYLSFEIEFNQTKNCTQTPRVEWTFYTLHDSVRNHSQNCLNENHIGDVDINAQIEAEGEIVISDHKSIKEILPRATLFLGYHLVCVMAYVHKEKKWRASTCGYIEIVSSNVVVGQIIPKNKDIAWSSHYPLTLTADFRDPDRGLPLVYEWHCLVHNYGRRKIDCPVFNPIFKQSNYNQRDLVLSAGFLRRDNTLTIWVDVWIINSKSHGEDSLRVWAETSYNPNQMPMFIDCEKSCTDIVGAGKSIILKNRFPHQSRLLIGITYDWGIWLDFVKLDKYNTTLIIPQPTVKAGANWEGIRTVIPAKNLKPGVLYRFGLSAEVIINTYRPDGSHTLFPLKYYTQTWYQFKVEPPPTGKGCHIRPSRGEAVFTQFTVECKDFRDEASRLPLVYRLYQLVNVVGSNTPVHTLIAYSGSSVMNKITLSTQGSAGVSIVKLQVEVKNVKGTQFDVPLSVLLTTLDQSEVLKRLIGNIKVQSGGQEDARTMKDIATVISVDSTASFISKVETRREVLNNVVKLDSDSKDNIEQVSHVLSASVEKVDEIDPAGLESGITTASRLAKYLGKVAGDNLELTKNVAESQVNALSRLIYVSAINGETISSLNKTENNLTDKTAEFENIRQSLMATQAIGQIADVLLSSITDVNESVKMITEFMNLFVAWREVNADTNFEVETEGAKFSLPASHSGVVENEIVETEFEVFKKNPYGWTTNNVHGNMPVVKVNLVRQQKKHLIKGAAERKTFRFDKPADIFLNYNVSREENYYPMLIKVVKQRNGANIIRMSSCLQLTVQVSTTRTTVMTITSPDNLKIMVKSKYTNTKSYFDGMYDEEMLEMPLRVPSVVNTSAGLLFRDKDLLFLPQLTQQQIKRNNPFYRIRISLKLHQLVDTTLFQRVEIVRNNSKDEDEEPGEYYNVTIEATPHDMSCLHFDEVKQDYLSDDCTVSMYSDLKVMHCRCVVAATYTGSVLVLPRLINPLDIGLFLEVFKNPLVVSMVVALWLIYIALISWGRMRDKDDEKQTDVTVLDDNREDHNYVYMICVVTGWSASSATSSNVFMYLKGSWYQSENHVFQDPTRHLFRAGAENWFMLTTQHDIGDLQSVVVWTDFSGAYPSWFLSSVYVQNMQTSESWMCPFNSWISVHQDIEELQAEIPAIKDKVYSSKLRIQLVKKGQHDIRNEHLWFGILAKTPYNKFTRVRRLTTGLSLLQSLMLLNLMFFGIRDREDPGQFIEVLDQQIHVTSVIIGIQTSFIIFWLGIGISMLFNRVAPYPKQVTQTEVKNQNVQDLIDRRKRREQAMEESDSSTDDSETSDELDSSQEPSDNSERKVSFEGRGSNPRTTLINKSNSAARKASSVDPPMTKEDILHRNESIPSQRTGSSPKSTTIPGSGVNADFKTTDKPKETPVSTVYMLPWWFIYVTWTLLAIYNMFLAYYVMLYGLSLGYEKSVDWALAFFTGFAMSIAVIQPLKVVIMVFILVLIFKQGHTLKDRAPVAKLNDGIRLVHDRNKYNRLHKKLVSIAKCSAPINTAQAKAVLERLDIERAAREMLRDLFLYTVFMVSLALVVYGHIDIRSQFLQTQYVKHRFLKTPMFEEDEGEGYESLGELDNVKSVDDMWDYIKNVIAPEMLKDEATISTDYDIYLMGTSRLRQVRSASETDSCEDLPDFLKHMFVAETCSYSSYYTSEETKSYENTWNTLSNVSKDIIDDSPYVYRTSKELNGAIVIGQYGLYSGGGYVIPFGQDDLRAMEDALTKLYNSDWIDELTKCVFVEFTLYNAASNHFTNVIIAFEFANFGALFPSAFISSAILLNHELISNVWFQLSEALVMMCTVFYIFVEIQDLRRLGFRQYFRSVWNCLEFITILLTCAVGIGFFLRYYEFVEILKDFQKYGHSRFLNFQAVFQVHKQLHIFLAILEGFAVFKMLKVTAFNPLVVITFRSFSNAQENIYGLLLITVILFLGFAMTGVLFFGKVLRSYRSVGVSLMTLLFFILSESEFDALVEADLYLGRMYFLIVNVVSQYIIVNFFCSLLQEGFELTRYMAFRREQDTINYMMSRVQFYSGLGPRNVRSKKAKNI